MSTLPTTRDINLWFPPVHQDRYIQHLVGQSGLTRRQATCFVRLWGYAHLQQGQAPPITGLSGHVGTFDCSHSQAADLFYSDHHRGSERSAGMMIDQLVTKHLVRREPFDGGPTRLRLQIPDSFLPKESSAQGTQLYADAFNVRTDASLVAAFLEESYSWVSQRSEVTSFKITKVLRQWATQYPHGLRVLRKVADDEPVGFAAFFPTHPDSEEKFHRPPSVSLHLSTLDDQDPIQVAAPGDERCYAVFVRGWQIHLHYWNYATACQLLQDSQATLTQMQEGYPNLCDIYTITIHPRLEALALALGFRAMKADPHSSLRWYYTPLDHFLRLDVDEALVEFDFQLT